MKLTQWPCSCWSMLHAWVCGITGMVFSKGTGAWRNVQFGKPNCSQQHENSHVCVGSGHVQQRDRCMDKCFLLSTRLFTMRTALVPRWEGVVFEIGHSKQPNLQDNHPGANKVILFFLFSYNSKQKFNTEWHFSCIFVLIYFQTTEEQWDKVRFSLTSATCLDIITHLGSSSSLFRHLNDMSNLNTCTSESPKYLLS